MQPDPRQSDQVQRSYPPSTPQYPPPTPQYPPSQPYYPGQQPNYGQRPGPSATSTTPVPGALVTLIGSGVAVLGFLFLPWLSFYGFFSVSGWQLLSSSSSFVGSSANVGLFVVAMLAILVATLLNLGVGIAGMMGRGSSPVNLVQIISGFLGIGLIALGLFGFLQATASSNTSSSISGSQVNYFQFIGFGVYVTVAGLIVALVGGFTSRREHWV